MQVLPRRQNRLCSSGYTYLQRAFMRCLVQAKAATVVRVLGKGVGPCVRGTGASARVAGSCCLGGFLRAWNGEGAVAEPFAKEGANPLYWGLALCVGYRMVRRLAGWGGGWAHRCEANPDFQTRMQLYDVVA